MYKIFFSERLDFLAEILAEELSSDGLSPLHPRTVLLPNHQMKPWLMLALARFLPAAMGFRVLTVEKALKGPSFPTRCEMFGSIYGWLKKAEDPLLVSYIQGKEKRLIELSDHLCSLFYSYGKCDLKLKDDWQSRLYRELFEKGPWKITPEHELTGPIHVFGCDFLSEKQWRALARSPLSIYLFSPCLHFWEDLCTHWEKKRLIRKTPKVEPYLRDAHPLLANWGKLGRETLKWLDSLDCQVEERYGDETGGSVLSILRKGLLCMEATPLPHEDDSIRVFQTGSSRLREIEILKSNVEELHRRGVPFSEMIVLAPDINVYVPLIEFVFEGEIPYRLQEVEMQSHFLQGLFSLTTGDLSSLFENPAFYRKRNWDLEKVLAWLKEGLDSVCQGLMTQGPIEIGWSEADLLEEVVQTWLSLQNDVPKGEKSFAEWAAYLEEMGKKYLVADEEGTLALQKLLSEMRRAKIEDKFPVDIIHPWLKKAGRGPRNASHLHAIQFGSLQTGSLFPSKALFLMGMDEEHFPRKDSKSSLDLLSGTHRLPSAGDHDRYLMLHVLFAAREYLYLSYGHISPDEGKPIEPAVVLQELLNSLPPAWIITAPAITSVSRKFVDFFKVEEPFPALPSGQVTVTLFDLNKLARHPWEFYLQKTWGINLEKQLLDSFPVQKNWFARETLKQRLDQRLKERLPPGLIGIAQEREIAKLSQEWQTQLLDWDLDLFTLSLLESCRQKKQVSPQLIETPAVVIDVTEQLTVKIIGDLKMMSKRGIVTTSDEILPIWPECLTAAVASGAHEVVFLKKGKIEPLACPRDALREFLIYYFRALSHPSPLIPQWSDFILKEGKKEKNYWEDRTFEWVLSRAILPPDEKLREKWDWLKGVFSYAAI